ncbi:outer membrane beta-barrel protein [Xanthobacter sp. KR7-65]|uniref:outer membrane protein n=1 Tax=Xanthobacter sp. KR7-65 TaxID=3156612 RepID=UPI0032B450C6
MTDPLARFLLIAALAGLNPLASASAADLSAAPVVKGVAPLPEDPFAGFYLGIAAGYGRGATQADGGLAGASAFSFDTDGALAAGYGGYNWRSGAFLAGAEVEIGYMGISGSALQPLGGAEVSTHIGAYGALTGRLGVVLGTGTLIYGKGGVALAWPKLEVQGPGLDAWRVEANAGWTAGAGVEQALAGRWLLRAEYQYFDFGEMTANGAALGGPAGAWTASTLDAHTLKAGIAHRF